MNSDLLMRSILEGGQEEVPAHVWEGVSAGLDAVKRRKKIALWWRRSAVAGAVSAAAAAVAAVLFLNPSVDVTDVIPREGGNDLIAVVAEEPAGDGTILAEARPGRDSGVKGADPKTGMMEMTMVMDKEMKAVEEVMEVVEEVTEIPVAETRAVKPETVEVVRFPESWDEEEIDRQKIRTSVVIAGLTGTNNANINTGKGIVRLPSLNNEPLKTGIRETGTESTYGIPVSFGAGVKVYLAPKWSMSAGINWSMLSRTFAGDYTKVEDGSIQTSITSDIRNVQHYIGIPVNVYYDILENDRINFYAYAGGTAEKCIANRYEVLNAQITHKDNPAGLQFSANAGIGVEFMLGRHLGLYMDPSLRYYFDNNQPKSIRTAQPFTLGFEMGLRINL